jgi:hypothetical protein
VWTVGYRKKRKKEEKKKKGVLDAGFEGGLNAPGGAD